MCALLSIPSTIAYTTVADSDNLPTSKLDPQLHLNTTATVIHLIKQTSSRDSPLLDTKDKVQHSYNMAHFKLFQDWAPVSPPDSPSIPYYSRIHQSWPDNPTAPSPNSDISPLFTFFFSSFFSCCSLWKEFLPFLDHSYLLFVSFRLRGSSCRLVVARGERGEAKERWETTA